MITLPLGHDICHGKFGGLFRFRDPALSILDNVGSLLDTPENCPLLLNLMSSAESKLAKKPNSTVPGDIHPSLYALYTSKLAVPITAIFNLITRTKEWPKQWAVEYVTVIPKCPLPAEIGDCRNLSCTNFLSKVYESFVLEWARQEVKPGPNQYGGEKGCGADHFLVNAVEEVFINLEDNRAACIATTIDYSKAFNRLSHEECLLAFKRKGASTDIMRLLGSFMMGRKMTVRIGGACSDFRAVNAGAPQGSVLGSYLFNVGIDDIEEGFFPRTIEEIDTPEVEHTPAPNDYPTCSTPKRVAPSSTVPSDSPMQKSGQDFLLLPTPVNVPPWLRKPKDHRWQDRELLNMKYIDDGLNLLKVNMKLVRLLLQGQKHIKIVQPDHLITLHTTLKNGECE